VTIVYLGRHGETDWNAEGRFQGHADVPLNDAGRAQAHALAERLAAVPLAAICTSDLSRAVETAEIVAAGRGLRVDQYEALREVDVGEWSGLTREEIEARWPGSMQLWRETGYGWREGETYEALGARIAACLTRVAAEHDGAQILYVGHGAAIRTVLARALGMSVGEYRRTRPTIANGDLHRVSIQGGRIEALPG
jgi:broad specificity phosphatase PhoE